MSDHVTRRAGTRVARPGALAGARPPGVAALVLLVIGYLAAFGTIADMRFHQSVEDQRGVNLHGYRGPVARQRKIESVRLLLLGGRWAFGTGLVKAETPAAYLERNLHQQWRTGNTGLRTTVVNLAWPGDGPASYVATLEDYRALDGDVIVLLDDPARSEGPASPSRHESAMFRRTGYFPLLTRVFSRAPSGYAEWTESAAGRDPQRSSEVPDCSTALKPYCDSVTAAIDYGVSHGKRVLVVRPPAGTPDQRAREGAARGFLTARFAGNANVRMLDLSAEQELWPAAADAGRNLHAGESDRLAELMTGPALGLIRK